MMSRCRTLLETPVLISLLRRYLPPYRNALIAVVVLQFFGTLASLYLPTLNADIIDNGVAKADTAYILQIGAVMLAITFVQVACTIGAVWFGARSAMGFGRDIRAAIFHQVGAFSAREVTHFGAPSLITRTTNDVQQVQMLVLLDLHDDGVGADHVRRRHHHGAAPGRRARVAHRR